MNYKFVFILVLILSACGGGKEATITPADTQPPPAPTNTKVPPTPTVPPTPSASEHNEQGDAYFDQGDWKQAAAEFQAAIELEPDNALFYGNLGAALGELGQFDQALAALEKSLELDPDYAKAHSNLCFTYMSQGELEAALAECETALTLDDEDADTYNNLGVIYVRQDNREAAIAQYQRAIQLDAEHDWAHNNLGRAYSDLGRLDEAIVELREATRITPDRAISFYNLGLTLARQESFELALPEYQKALELDPNLIAIHKDLGVIYRNLGQAEQAVAAFETFLQLAPDTPQREAIEAEIAQLKGPETQTLESLLSPPAANVVADFTAYQNPNSGLSFQYPAEWQLSERNDNSVIIASHPDLLDGLQAGETGVQLWVNLTTFQEWGISDTMEGLNHYIGNVSQDIILDGPAEVQINGQAGVAVLLRMESDDPPQSTILAVLENGERLIVTAANVNLELETQLFPTMAAIMASIQMSDSATEGVEQELPPGNTIIFDDSLEANEEDKFVLMVSPSGGSLMVTVEPSADLDVIVELYDSTQKTVLVSANDSGGQEGFSYDLSRGPYNILVRGVNGAAGEYSASFMGTTSLFFNLLPSYTVSGRLEEYAPLNYVYAGFVGATLNVRALPDPDTGNDISISVYSLTRDPSTALLTVNAGGVGAEEALSYAIPQEDIYLIEVIDVAGKSGEFLLTLQSE